MSSYFHEMIKADRVVIFTYSTCPYSKHATLLFRQIGHQPKTFALDCIEVGEDIHRHLKRISGCIDPPYVFIHGAFVGGVAQVVELLERQPTFTLATQPSIK